MSLVRRKGGCCSSCGWKPRRPREFAAIDFHHVDPATKAFPLAGTQFLLKSAEAEAGKCALLCANCHRIHHAQEWDEVELPLKAVV